jgi:hypothetical protein
LQYHQQKWCASTVPLKLPRWRILLPDRDVIAPHYRFRQIPASASRTAAVIRLQESVMPTECWHQEKGTIVYEDGRSG